MLNLADTGCESTSEKRKVLEQNKSLFDVSKQKNGPWGLQRWKVI